MKRIIINGRQAMTAVQASSTMFLSSVWPLVRCMASPKHPQSLTGLAIHSQSVTNVITTMNTSDILEADRLWMAKSRKMPRQNSIAESSTEVPKVKMDGTYCASESASR